ncbi:transposase [Bacillus pseudomycoides]|uniref:transposase n=1 Tax=Bacillus pseudomycoides TaxID=64104 RepID=UPI003F73545C
MVKKGTTFNTYSDELKLSAVQSYLNGEGSYQVIAKQYNIRSSTQLKDWRRKYKEFGEIKGIRGKNNGTQGILHLLQGTGCIFKKDMSDYMAY